MLAHAPQRDERAPDVTRRRLAVRAPDAGQLALAFIRYLDILLVLAAIPFVLLASLPLRGFALGGAAWIATRAAVAWIDRHAWAARTVQVRAALHLASILGRVWFVALAVLLARFAWGTREGIAAAVVVLAAYTVELALKLTLRRSLARGVTRPS
jgi:hypothetical protein